MKSSLLHVSRIVELVRKRNLARLKHKLKERRKAQYPKTPKVLRRPRLDPIEED